MSEKDDSDRARGVEKARAAHSAERLRETEEETRRKLDLALKNFSETVDLPDEDSKVQDLRKLAAERGIEWPAKSSRPPMTVGEMPTQPSAAEWQALRSPRAVSMGPTSAPKILVIDDDRDTVDTLATILDERGYRVWRAYDGFDAVVRLQEMPSCDLILLDVQMPRIDGREFLRYFDKSPHAHIPIVIISGGHKPIGEFDDRFVFLGKPLDVESLLSTVDAQVRTGKGRE